jgi:hypothetical protein
MDLIQFSITFLIAFVLGVTLTLLSDIIKINLLKFYKVWTFRHKALIPFEPSEINNRQMDENPKERVD